MLKHGIVTLFLLGSLALGATTAAQTAGSAVTPDRTLALWNGTDLSNWDAAEGTEVEFRRIEIGPLVVK